MPEKKIQDHDGPFRRSLCRGFFPETLRICDAEERAPEGSNRGNALAVFDHSNLTYGRRSSYNSVDRCDVRLIGKPAEIRRGPAAVAGDENLRDATARFSRVGRLR
jgi:hypothetical protein